MNNLINLLNSSNFVFYFLVVDDYLDIDLYPTLSNFHLIYAYPNQHIDNLKSKNAPYFCLAKQGIDLPEKNTGRLLSEPLVVEYIKNTSQGKTPCIIPFKPSAKIDLICRKNNWKIIANDSSLNRLLEDKLKFYDLAVAQNIPVIPSRVCALTPDNFASCQTEFGPHLVVQTHFGWAGKSTFTFSSWDEVLVKLTPGITVKISPYLSGYSLLNNCCLTHAGLIQSPPALQFTGLPGFTTNPFTTVGRQWPSLAPMAIQEQVKQLTQDFADKILTPLNYKGFFGLDFFITNDNRVYLLECNPRLTASYAFYTRIELKNNLIPLFFYHILEFTGLDYPINIAKEQERFYSQSLVGAELTPKDADSNTVIKYNDFQTFTDSLDPIVIKPEIVEIINTTLHAR